MKDPYYFWLLRCNTFRGGFIAAFFSQYCFFDSIAKLIKPLTTTTQPASIVKTIAEWWAKLNAASYNFSAQCSIRIALTLSWLCRFFFLFSVTVKKWDISSGGFVRWRLLLQKPINLWIRPAVLKIHFLSKSHETPTVMLDHWRTYDVTIYKSTPPWLWMSWCCFPHFMPFRPYNWPFLCVARKSKHFE